MAPTPHQAKVNKAKIMAGGKKQPNARVARYLKSQESQMHEGPKNALLMKGIKCSGGMSVVLKDLRSILAPSAKLLSKNNDIVPFDDASSIEFLSTKNDCCLFGMASHNKKRPNNLVIGRTFDHQILDMAELGLIHYKSLFDYRGMPKKRLGSKPMMLFLGDKWHLDDEWKKLQNLLVDFFRGEPVEKISLSGVDHMMSFSVSSNSDVCHMRTYYVKLKKHPNGGSTPLPHLTASGPDMDFKVRRTEFASPDLWKAAIIQPTALKGKKKKKNQTTNLFGETMGRLHLDHQDLDKVQGKRSKALRVAGKLEAQKERDAINAELEQEKSTADMEFQRTYGFAEHE
uniref:Ribosome production factor 2 homolog n=1 Tax=Proboscia inermis TaxID=420281 RepID=A0A7S0CL36_9STRA|mmetsp:Transcript_7237/g.7388  ORF Transcript_7237/g.7388 Transcript_7237/m.7388 type:complete len:343 (+) Transcript_7237:130-1158(+)|eukprot:CAMPEP_0171301628 /NCGR_PEP_ID=MMETSP0816-20121228/10822_1 /TAXON_ID=420281 /ORGANISM="Proboscia inermis, Strain CCAP1064/1" /LENGTH=342 /DNA_ID=CAMNT_0011779355 /DNA_START=117 /DNA_END=1145 /DNA_ORIENTATION=+